MSAEEFFVYVNYAAGSLFWQNQQKWAADQITDAGESSLSGQYQVISAADEEYSRTCQS